MLLGQIRPIELQYVEGNEYRSAICCCLGRLLSGRREPILQHRKVRCAAVIRDGDLTIQQGYSGADIAHICETAAERALLDSVTSGEPRLIGQADLEAAAAEVKPSLGTWLDTARNVALFANGRNLTDSHFEPVSGFATPGPSFLAGTRLRF